MPAPSAASSALAAMGPMRAAVMAKPASVLNSLRMVMLPVSSRLFPRARAKPLEDRNLVGVLDRRVHGHRRNEDDADEKLRPKALDAAGHEARLDDRHDERPEHRADDFAGSAEYRGAPDEDARDDDQEIAHALRGKVGCRLQGQQHAGKGRQETHQGEQLDLFAVGRDAHDFRHFRVVADEKEAFAETMAIEQAPDEHRGGDRPKHLHRKDADPADEYALNVEADDLRDGDGNSVGHDR